MGLLNVAWVQWCPHLLDCPKTMKNQKCFFGFSESLKIELGKVKKFWAFFHDEKAFRKKCRHILPPRTIRVNNWIINVIFTSCRIYLTNLAQFTCWSVTLADLRAETTADTALPALPASDTIRAPIRPASLYIWQMPEKFKMKGYLFSHYERFRKSDKTMVIIIIILHNV